MNLIIDIGNSSAKVGIFNQQELIEKHVFASIAMLNLFLGNHSFKNSIISSVSSSPEEIQQHIQAEKKFILTKNLPVPTTNLYATPSTLGVDRLAGVCGARQLFPGKNCLVIDAGTCITYDFIDKEGNYHGGGISPGLSMRFQAVNTFTAKLPLVQAVKTPTLIGNSTESCIQSGVILGLTEEIKGFVRLYEQEFEDLKVVLCGGDTVFFENQMKGSIFAVPELVLSGLNSILDYNVNL
ncbi:MAG TPA: type III pantothenate kinase [Cyclobacteriaceae bacterium]|nr:type III pantothenate kinase [Cyclobacteriaceae bacterium]